MSGTDHFALAGGELIARADNHFRLGNHLFRHLLYGNNRKGGLRYRQLQSITNLQCQFFNRRIVLEYLSLCRIIQFGDSRNRIAFLDRIRQRLFFTFCKRLDRFVYT
ncbi:hypothetical protein D3C74_368700 [compost metagenome]